MEVNAIRGRAIIIGAFLILTGCRFASSADRGGASGQLPRCPTRWVYWLENGPQHCYIA
jgi:hypothetical protein